MANYTTLEIIDAFAAVIDAVDDTGVVLTDRRTCEEDAEVLALLESQNDGAPHGWALTLMSITEADTPNGCEVQQTLGIVAEGIYPYQRRRTDGTTSEAKFRVMVSAVFAAVRASRSLGLDGRVWHLLLQTDEDFKIMDWSATGQDGVLSHYIKARLSVTNAMAV